LLLKKISINSSN